MLRDLISCCPQSFGDVRLIWNIFKGPRLVLLSFALFPIQLQCGCTQYVCRYEIVKSSYVPLEKASHQNNTSKWIKSFWNNLSYCMWFRTSWNLWKAKTRSERERGGEKKTLIYVKSVPLFDFVQPETERKASLVCPSSWWMAPLGAEVSTADPFRRKEQLMSVSLFCAAGMRHIPLSRSLS